MNIDRERSTLTQWAYLARLEEPQQFGLGLEAEVADLIKEQRAVLGGSNNPWVVPIRTRERTTLKAKEMALDKISRNRSAVEWHEGLR